MPAPVSGPLAGLRVLEFAAIGPVPFCGMLLSDLGADIVRIDRPGAVYDKFMVETRGRRSVELDLKTEAGVATALALIERADVVLEGLRPGVMERLGLGPDVALQRNSKLVYARMTGWGQEGPYSHLAGHDINYIAISGALHAIGPADQPIPPLNLVGDFGGGSMYLALGVLSALRHADRTGEGQVVDCAMVDGATSLMAMMYGYHARGEWIDRRATNAVDGGAPFYGAYRCSDGEFIALGAIEPQFYARMRDLFGLDGVDFDQQWDVDLWPDLKARIAHAVAQRSRAEWVALLGGTDACVAPVLSLQDAPADPHNLARDAFLMVEGVIQPAPAPRFSRTPGVIHSPPVRAGHGSREALLDWGVEA